jgi:hypothetical protein
MSLVLLRATLASLLLLTVYSKTQTAIEFSREKLVGNVLQVLAAHKVSAQANALPKDSVLPVAVRFHAPGCEAAVEVMPIDINLQEAPMLDAIVKPNYVRQFVYLDQVWTSESRLGMRLTWLRHRILYTLGMGRFVASKTGILVASPPGCRIDPPIDWSMAWDRRIVAASDAKMVR